MKFRKALETLAGFSAGIPEFSAKRRRRKLLIPGYIKNCINVILFGLLSPGRETGKNRSLTPYIFNGVG
jgi:hypothetical protein